MFTPYVMTVDISDLFFLKPSYSSGRVEYFRQELVYFMAYPEAIINSHGQVLITEGHNRTKAADLNGHKTILVNIFREAVESDLGLYLKNYKIDNLTPNRTDLSIW